ncbi:MAG: hypothetical protein ACYS0E_06095 [Planctomycetota bacterium]|jgi:hypothetical protein
MSKSLAILILFAIPAFAQDTEKPKLALESSKAADVATPHEMLASALLRFRNQKDLVVEARIKHKQPQVEAQAPAGNNGAVRVMIQTVNGRTSQEPFEGKVQAWRDADGTTVVVSDNELPGFGLYLSPERTIRRVTTEDRTPGTDQLRTELLSVMDGDRFSKHLMAAKLTHSLDEASGEHVWTGEIDKNIVRPVRVTGQDPRIAQFVGGMRPRVLRARIELRVSKASRITGAKLTIVRNDPAREMMRGKGFGARLIIRGLPGAGGGPGQPGQPGGQGQEIPLGGGDDDEKHDIEGISSTYTLDFSKKEASERAKAFKREILRALGE